MNYYDNETNKSLIAGISAFLRQNGFDCREEILPATTFLSGVDIRNGAIIYDAEKLTYPGDLLHEAGHLAVLLPAERQLVNGPENISGSLQAGAAEMAAIAWSWAASEFLGLPHRVVFHAGGYRDGSEQLIKQFSKPYNGGAIMGVPLLQWFEMTTGPEVGKPSGHDTFPKMKYWMRRDQAD